MHTPNFGDFIFGLPAFAYAHFRSNAVEEEIDDLRADVSDLRQEISQQQTDKVRIQVNEFRQRYRKHYT